MPTMSGINYYCQEGNSVAQRIKTFFVSDLSGEELGETANTVKFGYQGVSYEIDLSQEEADEFAEVMDRYVSVARRIGGRRQSGSAASPGPSRDLSAVREWARQNGYTVSSRGRIPNQVLEAYDAAN